MFKVYSNIIYNQFSEKEKITATLALESFSKTPPQDFRLMEAYFDLNKTINKLNRKTIFPFVMSRYLSDHPTDRPTKFFLKEIEVFEEAIARLRKQLHPESNKLRLIFEDYVEFLAEQLYYHSVTLNSSTLSKKINFNAGKTELISLFLILKDGGYFEFKNDNELAKFIEGHFTYSLHTPLKNTITEISKIRGLNRNKALCENKVKQLLGSYHISSAEEIKTKEIRPYRPSR